MARGRYIVFLDDDDRLYEGVLEQMISTLDSADPSIGAALFQCVLEGGRRWRERVSEGAVYDEADIVCGRALGLEKIIVYRREVFDEFQLPEELRFVEAVFVFAVAKKYKFLMRNAPGRYYCMSSERASTTANVIARSHLIGRGHELILAQHERVLGAHPKSRAEYMLKAVYRYAVAGSHRDAGRMLSRLRTERELGSLCKGMAFVLLGRLRLAPFVERVRLPVALRRKMIAGYSTGSDGHAN